MQSILAKRFQSLSSEKSKEIITDLIVYAFLILFMYTAASKFLTIKKFASTLAKSPLIGSYSLVVAWAIPVVEVLLGMLLVFDQKRKWSLLLSLILMILFTAYLSYMVLSGSKLPCHCGGVISSLTWQQHIWFNTAFIAFGIIGLKTRNK